MTRAWKRCGSLSRRKRALLGVAGWESFVCLFGGGGVGVVGDVEGTIYISGVLDDKGVLGAFLYNVMVVLEISVNRINTMCSRISGGIL